MGEIRNMAHADWDYLGDEFVGVLGADIPTTGEAGGSIIANDGISPTSRYRAVLASVPAGLAVTMGIDGSGEAYSAVSASYEVTYGLYTDGGSYQTESAFFEVSVGSFQGISSGAADLTLQSDDGDAVVGHALVGEAAVLDLTSDDGIMTVGHVVEGQAAELTLLGERGYLPFVIVSASAMKIILRGRRDR